MEKRNRKVLSLLLAGLMLVGGLTVAVGSASTNASAGQLQVDRCEDGIGVWWNLVVDAVYEDDEEGC